MKLPYGSQRKKRRETTNELVADAEWKLLRIRKKQRGYLWQKSTLVLATRLAD
jgi:hypothetical protein